MSIVRQAEFKQTQDRLDALYTVIAALSKSVTDLEAKVKELESKNATDDGRRTARRY